MIITIVYWMNHNQGVADWVSGIGSVSAILAIFWQSKQDTKRLEKQLNRENELRKHLENNDNIQKYKETASHLNKILDAIEIIKSDMKSKRKYPDTISNHFKFISTEFRRCAKLIDDEITEINVDLVDRSLLKELRKEIVYRIDLMIDHIDNSDIDNALYCLALIDHNTVKFTDGCPGDGTFKFEYTNKYSDCKADHKNYNKLLRTEIDRIVSMISASLDVS